MQVTLQDIPEITEDQKERLNKLHERDMNVKCVADLLSEKQFTELRMLIYLKQANKFKMLATDEYEHDKADKNYEVQAIKNYFAYLARKVKFLSF